MPVEWTVSHARRLVLAVGKGQLEAADIERYLQGVVACGAMGYAKIFNLTESTTLPTPEALRGLGRTVQQYASETVPGPLAIVAPSDASYRRAQVFARAARADRPLEIFRELHEASQWIKSFGPPSKT